MARIELRHAVIKLLDGFSGSGAVNESITPPADGDANLDINTVVVNGKLGTDVVPIGARFTVVGVTDVTYTVTARTPADGSATTTNIEFTPALATAAGVPVDDGVITFLPQQIDVKVGDGNLTYTENSEYEYELDRGQLDTVREGNQVPMDVNLDFVYEFVTTGTGEAIAPMDAIKGRGGAAEWVSSSADPCEPYAVDVEVEHIPPCGGADMEISIFPDFRADSKEFDLGGLEIDRSNGTYHFHYATTLRWLIHNEFNTPETDPNVFYRLKQPGPYHFQEAGVKAFRQFAKKVRLPDPRRHVRAVNVKV